MKTKVKKGRRKLLTALVVIIFVVVVGAIGVMLFSYTQIKKIPNMSFEDCLNYTLENCEDGVITVGIIQNGVATYKVYGNNAEVLENKLHTYEIGSLTKTFTALLISKAVEEGRLELTKTLDCYLTLSVEHNYPTIEQVLTHTSGLKSYYMAKPMVANHLNGRNDFCGVTNDMVLEKLSSLNISSKNYNFNYSNYGYAVLGLILEKIYGMEYSELLNQYVKDELGLENTRISDGTGDLGKLWDWKAGDAYIPAGAILSNIEDMLIYAEIQMQGQEYIKKSHEQLKNINTANQIYKLMNINMDSIGMAWIKDTQNNIVWHNGGTSNYNSYLGFSTEKNAAVVILSNLSPNYKMPVTVLGAKLLISME